MSHYAKYDSIKQWFSMKPLIEKTQSNEKQKETNQLGDSMNSSKSPLPSVKMPLTAPISLPANSKLPYKTFRYVLPCVEKSPQGVFYTNHLGTRVYLNQEQLQNWTIY